MPPTQEWLNAKCDKTNREWITLKNQVKQGWCVYYKVQDNLDDISTILDERNEFINKIKYDLDEGIAICSFHVFQQFVEMFDELKKKVECPYCFDYLKKDTIHIPRCGHLCCKECYEKIRQNTCKCGICNKNFPKIKLPAPSVWLGE